jgi:hypothetical protein
MMQDSYRSAQSGPDPVTEADAIVELMMRSTALRRRLLMLTLGASILGGGGGVVLYVSLAMELYGRAAGALFAAAAVLSFTALHRLSGLVARGREAAWIAELCQQHRLDPQPLAEAAAMLNERGSSLPHSGGAPRLPRRLRSSRRSRR